MTRKDRLLAYLEGACRGRAYRVGGKELSRTLHLSRTDLQELVNKLRKDKKPIASDRYGYFYADNAGEVYATIGHLRKMRDSIDAAIRGLEQSMDGFPGRG